MPGLIQLDISGEGICVLTFDRPGSPANFFDRETLLEFGTALDSLEKNQSIRGLVLASRKPSIFVSGADLHVFTEPLIEADVRGYLELGQIQISRLTALPFPTVAAIHGACLGGGYELCLACGWRIASVAKPTRIGLPETTLGLLPAWGGTTRLPRLIGLEAALDVILTGRPLGPEQAHQVGMIDEVAQPDNVVEVACSRILAGRVRREHRAPKAPPSAATLGQIARSKREALLRKTRGHNPAALKALDVAVAGVAESAAASLARERDAFMEIVRTQPTQNLLRSFFLQEQARKRDKNTASLPNLGRIAVIGAGTMGAGIAYWASTRGVAVVLRDVDDRSTAQGLARCAHLYDESVKHQLLTPDEARVGLQRITAASSDATLAEADLIIEAVAEVLETKQEVLRRLAALAPDSAILATNTSALSVTELARATNRPGQVVGLHFFNPVHRMPLVEVIAGNETDSAVARRSRQFVQQIGKLPVVVKDSPGFVVNRILMPYLMEAVRCLEAGAQPEEIDEAMLEFGMAMGPLRVIDEVGFDIMRNIVQTLERHFGERCQLPRTLCDLIREGMLGRKTGAGFYAYEPTSQGDPSSRAPGQAPPRPRAAQSAPVPHREELKQRMVLLMVNEAARCVEEGIVAGPAEVDFAMMLGAGFGAFLGGPLRYADSAGASRLVAGMERLVVSEGPRFAPCDLLRTIGLRERKFYRP